jgi:hypothetical protein
MNILDFLTNGQASQLNSNGDGAQRLAANILMQRTELMRSLLDSPRNVSSDCGYPEGYISTELYKSLYDREPVPARVVEVYPKECFQVQPTVFEDESADVVTPFEEAWDALGKQLRGEQSFYQEEESSAIWTYLYDADVKSGIGHYAGILLGIDDGMPLNEPAEMITATDGNGKRKASSDASRRLLFMRIFGESDMRINSLETDMQSPRYGQPTEYDISLIDPTEFTSLGLGASLPTNREVVHWSRVVHISEYGVLHTPRMQPVLNRLLDLRKLQGGSAEMYWRGAFPGYAIKTQPQLGADVDINKEDVKQQLTDYSNALQRFLVLMGMDITALAPQVSDPSSQIGAQLDSICIQLGIPKRIFMGSERGELASSQDDAAWNDRLKQRQIGVITPRIIIPVVDRLISLRVLPRPAKGYRVSWPDLTSKSDEEKAGIATQRTQAIAAYSSGQLETTLAPMDFWTRIMGFTEDESQSIIANAEEVNAQKEKEQAAKDMEAAKVQAEAQAKMDAAAKMAADTPSSEQTPTAPGLPTSPGKAPGQGGWSSPTQQPQSGTSVKPGGSNVGGTGSTPVAHSDPTLVADFDPSQARDTHGRWSPSGKANAFDRILPSGGTKKDQVVRDFYRTVHDDLSTTRPAGDPRFHDPLRLHIEQQLHELAGDHGEALYRTGAAGMTQIAFKKHEVNVVTDAPGQVTIFSEHLHGPDPRDPTTFTITHATPHEEVSYRLRKAAGLKVDKVAAEKYMAEDKKARNEFRAQRKAALEAQKTAREARRAEREARRLEKRDSGSSTQNVDIPAEEISQLINGGELDEGSPVAHFDSSQARDSHGKWTKGAVGVATSKAHDYIRENGPTSHDELAYHLVDEGIVDKHGDGVSLIHHLVESGHLVAGSDAHGGDALHVPPQHDTVESWKPAADTHAIIQRTHTSSTAADRVSSTATDATSHRRAAEAHASAVMTVGDTAERLKSENAPKSEVSRYNDLKSYHAQMEARHRSQSVGWPAKGLAPVNPEAARAARVATSPKESPISTSPSTSAVPTHTAADLDRMSMQQMRQLAIKLGVRGAKSKGSRSLREELLVRAVPESFEGLLGHSLSAEDISQIINSGELDVNTICGPDTDQV